MFSLNFSSAGKGTIPGWLGKKEAPEENSPGGGEGQGSGVRDMDPPCWEINFRSQVL